MRSKMPLDPKSLPVVKEVLKFLWEELRTEFIGTYDGWGWHLMTSNFEGLHNPEFEDLFRGVREQFPEFRFTFGFIGQKGFDLVASQSTLHGKKVISVKQ
jgi:hypothetical protein